MRKLILEEFQQTKPDFYVCKYCWTHIPLTEDRHCCFLENGLHAGVFHKAVNVQVNEPVHHRKVGAHTVADIYCLKCRIKLGWKYIQVDPKQVLLKNGMVKLIMEKFLKRKNNVMVDAVRRALDPIVQNPHSD